VTSPLRDALKAVAGGRRLSREETRRAFESILLDQEPASLAAGLLSALAAMGESADDVTAVAEVLRARVERLPVEDAITALAVDVCGTGGDSLGTFNVSTVTAFVVAGAGVPVAKHGGRAVSSTCGSADVLTALGVDIEMRPEWAAEALRRAKMTFLFAPLYHRAMKKIAPLRRELGVRTVFNLAGPLANPAGVKRQIVGVDRPARVAVVAEALAALGAEHALVFSNETGGDELLPFGRTVAAEVRAGNVRTFTVTAADFGLTEGAPEALRGGTAEKNAEILRGLLAGHEGASRETVLMNSAAALYVAGRVQNFRSGVGLAAASIDGGGARESLLRLISISRTGKAP
jgi:anthranilate phosphoribosyltransferase